MKIAYVTDLDTDSDLELGLPELINEKLSQHTNSEFIVLDDRKFHFFYSESGTEILYEGQRFNPKIFDILFLGDTLSIYLNNEFINLGIPVLNSPNSYFFREDKIKFTAMMSQLGLPIPASIMARNIDQVTSNIDFISPPYVVKYPTLEGGIGVFLADSLLSLLSMMGFLWLKMPGQSFLIQEFIDTSDGRTLSQDYRCTVIGNEIIPIVRKSYKDFRANWSRGSNCHLTKLTSEEIKLIYQISEMSGLDIMGIDFLKGKDGKIYFTEMNQAPGLMWNDSRIDDLHIDSLLKLFRCKIS